MGDVYRLWVNLGTAGRRHDIEPRTYLLFRSSGKIVGLPDEPGSSVVDRAAARPRVRLSDTDVLGLGLVDADFSEGVAVYQAEPDTRVGWRCTPATMRVVDAEGPTVVLA
jgi:hypothetical protein